MTEPKLRRRDRRVVLALLSDADNLAIGPLADLAQVSAIRVSRVIDMLEDDGFVTAHWQDGTSPRSRFYRLTPDGRTWAHRKLGLLPSRGDQPKENR